MLCRKPRGQWFCFYASDHHCLILSFIYRLNIFPRELPETYLFNQMLPQVIPSPKLIENCVRHRSRIPPFFDIIQSPISHFIYLLSFWAVFLYCHMLEADLTKESDLGMGGISSVLPLSIGVGKT